jgi:hypothetical protein
MRNVVVVSESRDHAIDPASLPDTLFDAPSADSGIVVTLELSESAASLLSDYDATISDPTAGKVRAELTVAHLVNLRKLVAIAPGVVRVVSPDFAVADIARWAESGAAWHKKEPLTRA